MCLHLRATVASPVAVRTRCNCSWEKSTSVMASSWSENSCVPCLSKLAQKLGFLKNHSVLTDLAVQMQGCSVDTCRLVPWTTAGHSRSRGWCLQRCGNLRVREDKIISFFLFYDGALYGYILVNESRWCFHLCQYQNPLLHKAHLLCQQTKCLKFLMRGLTCQVVVSML